MWDIRGSHLCTGSPLTGARAPTQHPETHPPGSDPSSPNLLPLRGAGWGPLGLTPPPPLKASPSHTAQ